MGDSAGKALTPKQERFIAEYLVDLCGAAAARRAGYSEKTAGKIADQTLAVPAVQASIAAALEARERRTKLTQDMVVEGLLTEARQGDSCSARVSAWGLLGKHLGMFTEKLEHSGPGGTALQVVLNVLPKE